MKDQHTMIPGYRDLSQAEIDLITSAKHEEQRLATFVKVLFTEEHAGSPLDERWKSIAITHFEQGFMALIRAVAKPSSAQFK